MNIKKVILISILILSVNLKVYSQANIETLTSIIPPSPTAASLGTYGQVPVGMFTGTAQFNIPIYQLNSKKLSLPISLNYSTNGVKVDQIASWVGMGWSLNAGGVITRLVKDKPDDKGIRLQLNNKETDEDINSGLLNGFLFNGSIVDLEPDIYSYNFNGQSGKFIIDLDGFPRLIPHQDVVIEVINTSQKSFIITTKDGTKYYFGEIAQDGGLYSIEWTMLLQNNCSDERGILDHYNTAWYLTRIVHPTGDTILFKYGEGLETTSSYDSGISQYFTSSEHNIACSKCSSHDINQTCVNKVSVRTVRLEEITTDNIKVKFESSLRIGFDDYKLDAISVEDKNTLISRKRFDFNYIYSNNTLGQNSYSETSTQRMFLSSLSEYGIGLLTSKKHTFEYYDINKLPVRLSFSQDHWGYYNGVINGGNFLHISSSLANKFPSSIGANREPNFTFSTYGSLKKITYPTGGVSEIDYDPQQYWGEDRTLDPSDIVYYSLSNSDPALPWEDGFKSDTINIPIHQDRMHITAKLTCIDGQNNCDDEDVYATVRIRREGGASVFYAAFSSDHGDDLPLEINQEVFNQPSGNYIIELDIESPSSLYEVEISFSYYDESPTQTVVYKNIEVGGIRVKRITTKESLGSIPQIERYYYGSLNDLEKSSGTIPKTPNYYYESSFKTNDASCTDLISTCLNYNLSSNSSNSIYNNEGNHIVYHTVVKSNGENFENGGEYYEYLASADWPGRTKGSGTFIESAYSNNSWNSGTLKRHKVFKKDVLGDFIILSQNSFKYNFEIEFGATNDDRNSEIFTAAVIRRNSIQEMILPYLYGNLKCTQTDISTEISIGWKCLTDHTHIWTLTNNSAERKCISPFNNGPNNIKLDGNHHICQNKQVGDGYKTDQNTISHYDVTYYDLLSRWGYLKNKTTTNYDEYGENPISTFIDYEYNNVVHSQISKIITTNSKGDSIVQNYYYPLDYDYPNLMEFQPLVENYINDVPIDIRKEINGKLISGQLAKYNDKGQVIEIYQAENELGTILSLDIINPYSYGKRKLSIYYDNITGNIQEYNKENDVSSVYIWGYKEQYPVAKVDNATHSQVVATLTSTELTNIKEGSYSDVTMRGVLNKIRTSLTDSKVTTYTYDPLIGVTSITDPRDYTIYYEYDDFNRLKYVKDAEGNILSKNEYHYKNQ